MKSGNWTIEMCCPAMEDAVDIKMFRIPTAKPFVHMNTEFSLIQITFCPFCGEKIRYKALKN